MLDDITTHVTQAYVLLDEHFKQINRDAVELTRVIKDEDLASSIYSLRHIYRLADADCRIALGKFQSALSKALEKAQDLELLMHKHKKTKNKIGEN